MPRIPANQKKNPGPKPKPTKEWSPVNSTGLRDSPGHEMVERLRKLEKEPKSIEEESPTPPVQVIERRIETVTIEVPLGEPPHRFEEIHIEGRLIRDDAHTFARLRQALRDQNARTADGREVRTNPDILRWLMEKIYGNEKH